MGSERRSLESKACSDRAKELVREFLESVRSELSAQAQASVRLVAINPAGIFSTRKSGS
jgi:hypothetical protein